MSVIHRDRGANIRRNLRRWRKPLVAITVGWMLLTLAVCTVAIIYAHAHQFGERRIQTLGANCGTVLGVLLAVVWLTILVLADRRKSE